MLELVSHLFASVCGQNPGHTWAPGGLLLPCCQRCTGLYAGAAVAALLHLWLKPKLSGRFLEIHGVFLVFMAPFGFHWLAQGPALRTITGVLFGFAVVTFLWLPLSGGAGERAFRPLWGGGQDASGAGGRPAPLGPPSGVWSYFTVLGATLVLLPVAARAGGTFVAYILSGLIACGALVLALLVGADLGVGLRATLRWVRQRASPRALA